MKNKTIALTIGAVLLVSAVAAVAYLSLERTDDDERIGVVVSIAPQKEFAEKVGGELVKVTVMVPEGRDPHTYEPTPSQMKDVAGAELYFMVGSGVEFENAWMDKLEEQNDDMLVVDGSVGVTLLDIDGEPVHDDDDDDYQGEEEEGVHDDDDSGDGSKEGDSDGGDGGDHDGTSGTRADHVHDGADPHIWMSLRNAASMVRNLLEALVEVDPDNAVTYRDNAQSYIDELEALDFKLTEDLEDHAGERFLVYHPAFGYFAHDYQLVQMAIEEEGKEPGTAGLAAVIDQAKESEIRVVFVSPQFDRESARTIAEEIDGEVITLNSLAGDYLDNIDEVASKLISALFGGDDPGGGR